MKKKKIITVVCSLLAVALIAVGCAKGTQTNNANQNQTSDQNLTGTISIAGSTSMEKLCEAMSESFMADNQGVTVTVEYVGSGAGIESLSKGSVDIGNASRNLKDDEKTAGCVENVVAIDGIAVVTDKANTVKNLSSDDLKKIYTGQIKNWKELGGNDEAVVVVGRESGSGTRDAFEELLDIADKCEYAQQLDSTGAALAKVSSTPGAIGYVSLDVVDDSVNAVSIDGTEPTEAEILQGNYLLSRPFVMATKGDVSSQNELVKKWFEYVKSDKGKEIIKKVGLIVPNEE